jgi:hypothetical protein
MEFLDFYSDDNNKSIKYVIFDSKFTTYKNLSKLDQQGIKFITIQRKGRKLLEQINAIPASEWKQVRVPKANNKSRFVTACQRETILYNIKLNGDTHTVRQIFIKNGANDKPAIIITNDFKLSIEAVVRKYALRWLVEKEISEQIHFFHLNSVSSGIVVKVDFDLTMSILAHNLYRTLAIELPEYTTCYPRSIYKEFIQNAAHIDISDNNITVKLKKKRELPMIDL